MGRRRELAVRSALGGGRGRLVRQLLTECVLLSAAGGALGMLAAVGGVRGLAATQPGLAVWGLAVDAPVLLGSLGIALATGVSFGLLPGLLAIRDEPADALHGGRSRSMTTARGSWMRGSLVVAQVALCTMLLAAAAAFLRTFVELSSSELGFEPANVLTARASLQGPDYGSGDAVSALYRRTLAELARVPARHRVAREVVGVLGDCGGARRRRHRPVRRAGDPGGRPAITAFRSMDEVVGGPIATRSRMFLLGLFAAAALTLAAGPLLGAVAQRTKEIGIRLALGASGRQVTARFARQGIALAALGAVVGAGAAVLAIELLRRLTEAQPLDPWTIAGVVLVLGAVSAAATVVPARRAARVDPMLTLRVE